ncbi:hypothetical protein E4O92_03985 [Massilia horti]|uniref:Anti-sigma factor n=1 Tax=Massilia horti TaxID=2562153 RepID=A0A4Y9T974_9BURK|nr:hypothetical protein E4O92_03985 [Massilia horti]
MLMAYADGELGEPVRSQVERAIRQDPALAARVAQHKAMRAMRARVSTAFAHIVNESVPPRVYPDTTSGKVVHLNAVRAARHQQLQVRDRPHLPWTRWAALAAALVTGVLAGVFGYWTLQDDNQALAAAGKDGALLAQGKLATALSQQMASIGTAGSKIRIGISFAAKDGNYCRSFAVGTSAGLACMKGGQWTIPVLAEGKVGNSGAQREAYSVTPPSVLAAIGERIQGAALSVDAERAARQRGWKR